MYNVMYTQCGGGGGGGGGQAKEYSRHVGGVGGSASDNVFLSRRRYVPPRSHFMPRQVIVVSAT